MDQESFYDADPSTRKKAIAYAKKWVDVAVADRIPQHPHAHSATIQLGAKCAAHGGKPSGSGRVRRREKCSGQFGE